MKSYGDATRQGVKWYQEAVIELSLNTLVVNAYILYLCKTQRRIKITEFWEKLGIAFLDDSVIDNSADSEIPHIVTPSPKKHKLLLRPTPQRGRCVACHKQMAALYGRKESKKLPLMWLQTFLSSVLQNKKHYSRLIKN